MASAMATKRLRKEFLSLKKSPLENIEATPLESNILHWHYVITGTENSPYAGGYYHGILKFPKEYPMKPPSILMYTPNGRFSINTRLCLSMSDFHPESWNPMWSVSSILRGLYSFMLEKNPTHGSITTSVAKKRQFAKKSLGYNVDNSAVFREYFPHLVDLHKEILANAPALSEAERLAEENQNSDSSAFAWLSEYQELMEPYALVFCVACVFVSIGYGLL